MSLIVCKGDPCDNFTRCLEAGACTYKSSAELAKEYRLMQQAQKEYRLMQQAQKDAPPEQLIEGLYGPVVHHHEVIPEMAGGQGPVVDFSGKVDGLGLKRVMLSPKSGVQMLDPRFLVGIGDVLTYGASKYAANNWLRGMSWTVVFGAVLRHLFAWFMGEKLDPKEKGGSGLPHLYHASCGIMFLAHYDDSADHQQFDDRVYK